MWGGYGQGWGWGLWGLLGMVQMLLWWVVLGLGIAVLVKWLIGPRGRANPHAEDRALDILRERYARGEIGKEEFEQKARDLAR
jgi:putative membrane protein